MTDDEVAEEARRAAYGVVRRVLEERHRQPLTTERLNEFMDLEFAATIVDHRVIGRAIRELAILSVLAVGNAAEQSDEEPLEVLARLDDIRRRPRHP